VREKHLQREAHKWHGNLGWPNLAIEGRCLAILVDRLLEWDFWLKWSNFNLESLLESLLEILLEML
jgi:hypothetical protein